VWTRASADGEEALRTLKAERPHAMLLDFRLPGVSGLECCGACGRVDREVAVIAVTAEADEDAGREALMRGAYDFLAKPADLDYPNRRLWHAVTPMLP
jgi:DNA-binding NtrC family response regulator